MIQARLHLLFGLLLALFSTLTACAGGQSPFFTNLIQPDLDASGVMKAIVDSNGGQPINLLEAVIKQGVAPEVARQGFSKFEQFRERIVNKRHLVLIDMTIHSGQPRFYMVDTASGKVDSTVVAHGEGSDPKDTGYAQYFSNVPNSKMTSLGAYLVQEKYRGKHGTSVRMDGLEESNSNVRDRDIVLHSGGYVRTGQGRQGRSWGCPAIPVASMSAAVDRLANGAFLYIYGINKHDVSQDSERLREWNSIPRNQWVPEDL